MVYPCALVGAFRIVVKNSRYTDKKLRQLQERLVGETLAVTVNIVVAENYIEAVNLVGGKLPNGKTVDFFEVVRRYLAGRNA